MAWSQDIRDKVRNGYIFESVELLASLSDSLSKAVASSKKILPETDRLATALEVVQRLGAFIKERHPTQYAPFLEVLEGFAKELEDNFSYPQRPGFPGRLIFGICNAKTDYW